MEKDTAWCATSRVYVALGYIPRRRVEFPGRVEFLQQLLTSSCGARQAFNKQTQAGKAPVSTMLYY